MEYKDYYKFMGVRRDAGPEEIKRAYHGATRTLTLQAPELDAQGRVQKIRERTLKLRVPKGVKQGPGICPID